MENGVLAKKHSSDLTRILFKECSPIPFLFTTHLGKPFTAIGKNKEGYYFFSSYFMLKCNFPAGSFYELMILEPVAADGCIAEYPDSFYSLQTTTSSIYVSVECFSTIQTFSIKEVNRELIDPCTKD